MTRSILVMTHTYPYPPTSGGRIRYFNLLKNLSEYFTIDLLSLWTDPGAMPVRSELEHYCRSISTVRYSRPVPDRFHKFKNIAALQPADLNWRNFHVSRQLLQLLEKYRADALWVWTAFLADYARLVPPLVRRIIDFDDLQHVRMRRMVKAMPWGRRKIGYLLEPAKAKRYERIMLKRFELAFVCSPTDRSRLQAFGTETPVQLLPNGVDIDSFTGVTPSSLDKPTLVYIGGLGSQGGEGLLRFVRSIFPRILSCLPEAHLLVGGSDPLPELRAILDEHPAINFCESPEHVQAILAKGWVLIVPLWVGSGTRIKILEASAMGIPTVTTRVGAEGLSLQDGRSTFIAGEDEVFAKRCVHLLRDESLRKNMGTAAQEIVFRYYGWSKICNQAAEQVDRLLNKK